MRTGRFLRFSFVSALSLLLMHACANSGTGMLPHPVPAKPAGECHAVDSFYIRPKGDFRYKYKGAWMQGNTVRHYFYNYSGSTLDYIDFVKREHVQLFPVPENLSNTMEGVGLLSADTIVFLLNTGMALYSPQGNLLQEYAFTERERKRTSWEGVYSPLLVSPFGYIYSRSQNKKSVLGYYDTATQRANAIPIAFPQPAKGDAGLLGQHSQAYFHNKVAVLFNISPDVYVYDFVKKTTQTYSVKSEYDTGFLPCMGSDMREVQNHLVTSGSYSNITYDPYRDELLVVYLHPQPLKNDSGYYNDPFQSRTASLIVVDAQLQHKREYVFPATRYWLFNQPQPMPQGVALRGAQTKADVEQNGMKYYLVNLR